MSEAPAREVVVGESSPGAVLAAISLARRLPAPSDLLFATREGLASTLGIPRHAGRERPYRLHVVGMDLAASARPRTLAAIAADPAEAIHWYDANDWTDDDAAEMRALTKTGAWHRAGRTHHPFDAIDAAASQLTLREDPFAQTLRGIAEATLSDSDESAFGKVWRDGLEALSKSPLELTDTVRPLLHGMPGEMQTIDRGEAEVFRNETDALVRESHPILAPSGDGKVVVLILPTPKRPIESLVAGALAKTGLSVAIVLYDRGDHAALVGRRHGAEPPDDVRPALAKLLKVPFVRRDRVMPGLAQVLLVDPPKDALEKLVGALR